VALFASLIAVGTLLLLLPFSSKDEPLSLSAALFTSTSAVCVTGLSVFDAASKLSLFGQVVLLLLIQIGGLGWMLSSTLLFLLFGRELGLHDRLVLRDTFGQVALRDTNRLLFRAIRFAFTVEVIGAVILTIIYFHSGRYGFLESIWQGTFSSISAFCNAGFDLKGVGENGEHSLMIFRSHPMLNLVIMLLSILGGLGFVVCNEIWERASKRKSRIENQRALSISTRLVLWATGILTIVGFLLFLIQEWSNPATLGNLPFGEKLMAALFQSVTLRSVGFSTLDFGQMTSFTLLFSGLWMFIGAAPGGTGGGIKVTTFALMLLAVYATLRGREDVEIFGRRLAARDVSRALVLNVLAIAAVVIGTFALTFSEAEHLIRSGITGNLFMKIQFEVLSAVGTAGLSTGITSALSDWGRLFLVILMFMGRLGPTTVATALLYTRHRPKRRLPEEQLNLG
jgi:trk system potassium uptake protein TrkH